jgi:hypothetical protein
MTFNAQTIISKVKSHITAHIATGWTEKRKSLTTGMVQLMAQYYSAMQKGQIQGALVFESQLIANFKSPYSGADRWSANGCSQKVINGDNAFLATMIITLINEQYPYKDVSVSTDDGSITVSPNLETEDEEDTVVTDTTDPNYNIGDEDPLDNEPADDQGELTRFIAAWFDSKTPKYVKDGINAIPGVGYKSFRYGVASSLSNVVLSNQPTSEKGVLNLLNSVGFANGSFKLPTGGLGKAIWGFLKEKALWLAEEIPETAGEIADDVKDTVDDIKEDIKDKIDEKLNDPFGIQATIGMIVNLAIVGGLVIGGGFLAWTFIIKPKWEKRQLERGELVQKVLPSNVVPMIQRETSAVLDIPAARAEHVLTRYPKTAEAAQGVVTGGVSSVVPVKPDTGIVEAVVQ